MSPTRRAPGERVRFDVELMMRLRAGKKWTPRDMEKHTGLSNAFLSQIQTGHSTPGFEAAVAIADAFGLSVEAFILRELVELRAATRRGRP